MINLIVSGCCGRMGKRIVSLAVESGEFSIVGAVEKKDHPDIGQDIGLVCGIGELGVPIISDIQKVIEKSDVITDFTSSLSTINNVKQAKAAHKPIVIGTTGLTDEEMIIIKSASSSIPILVSPNMSVGVNVLFNIVGSVASHLGDDYDIEIIETHHNQKKDAPSGTAKRLADEIMQAKGRGKKYKIIFGREGNIGKRPKGEIAIHAVRAGDVIGDHTVIFAGENERIEITHKAHSRDGLAKGALRSCKFIIGKSPKLYTMQDVIKEI
ncbi:MAG: 4-hydroxy-tetrahydrodipicolinate reductase [Candidatus Omnitrophica bacterium]|nr:4-hydroxy-tetrahydrodipicolinate reductase [Candidatus Omnitrophota bacterium]